MPDDFRLQVGFPDHPKTQKLIRRCGFEAFWSLVKLIEFCTTTRTDGSLAGMDELDIEIACGWRGEAGIFVATLVEVRFLDGDRGEYRLHDWAKVQPWVAGHVARSNAGRRAAEIRWARKGVRRASKTGTDRNEKPCDPQCPDPDPDPNTEPDPEPRASSSSMSADELAGMVTADLRWSLVIPPKWWPLMSKLAPYTTKEVTEAIVEAKAADGKPSCGLLLRIIERRRTEASKPEVANHPEAGTEWAKGRAKEDAERAGRKPEPEPTDEEFAAGKSAVADIIAGLSSEKAIADDA